MSVNGSSKKGAVDGGFTYLKPVVQPQASI